MNTTTKAIPTPLSLIPGRGRVNPRTVIRGDGYALVAVVESGASAAVLEEIIRRANEHDEILDVLQDMVSRYGPDRSTTQSTPWDRAHSVLRKHGRAQ